MLMARSASDNGTLSASPFVSAVAAFLHGPLHVLAPGAGVGSERVP